MIGVALAWLVSDAGLKAVGLVAATIYGAIKGRSVVVAGRAVKLSEAERLAEEVFEAVEALDKSGKLATVIAGLGGDRALAKYTRAMTLFAEGWRARHRGTGPDVFQIDAVRQVFERRAAKTSAPKG